MNRIKELRLEHGWKQDELGEMIQVGKGSVSRYEAEKRQLDPEAINDLCDLFGCTADYLLCRSSVRHPTVSEEDALLIHTYHALPLAIRQAVDGLMAPYIETAEKKRA